MKKFLAGVLLGAALVVASVFVFESRFIVQTQGSVVPYCYRIDRWTGRTWVSIGPRIEWREIIDSNPPRAVSTYLIAGLIFCTLVVLGFCLRKKWRSIGAVVWDWIQSDYLVTTFRRRPPN